MEYKKNYKIKLTKFGKKFFAFTIVLIIGISVLCLNNSNRNLKEETNNYLVEINYPKVNNKDLLAYVKEYLQNKEEEFKNDISDLENMNSSKYEFKTDYKISYTGFCKMSNKKSLRPLTEGILESVFINSKK